MKVLSITNEVFNRALPACVPILEKAYTATANFSDTTILKAFEETFNCRAYYIPVPIRVSIDDFVPEQKWTLYFYNDAEATEFLLRWS